MPEIIPLKAIYSESGEVTALAEFQNEDIIPVKNGGTGVSNIEQIRNLLNDSTTYISSSEPLGAKNKDMWWNQTNSTLYIYFNGWQVAASSDNEVTKLTGKITALSMIFGGQ